MQQRLAEFPHASQPATAPPPGAPFHRRLLSWLSTLLDRFRSPLAQQYLAWTFSLATCLTIIAIASSVVIEFRRGTSATDAIVHELASTFSGGLARATWQFNELQTLDILNAMANYPDISGAAFVGDFSLQSDRFEESVTNYSFPVFFTYEGAPRATGDLIVHVSYDRVRSSVMGHFALRVFENAIRSTIFVACSLVIFHYLVNRHILELTARVTRRPPNPDGDLDLIQLSRNKFLGKGRDEIDQLVTAFNRSRRDLNREFRAKIAREKLLKSHMSMITESLETVHIYLCVFDRGRKPLIRLCPEETDSTLLARVSPKAIFTLDDARTELARHHDHLTVMGQGRNGSEEDSGYFIDVREEDGRHWRISSVHLAHGTVAIFYADLTLLKQTEEALSLARKNEAIGKLTGGVAHDFNNLLAVVQGNTEILSLLAKDEALTAHIDTIIEACEKGSKLTRSLLSFSRSSVLNPDRLDLNELVLSTVRWGGRVLPDEVDVETELQDGLWGVWADAGLSENALLNIVINARDAMAGPGRILISTNNLAVAQEHTKLGLAELKPGPYVALRIEDTGSGIPEDIIEKVFDPFFTTKGPGKGSGVGLSSVYGFMQQSGGGIDVVSTLGVGTIFTLYFPASGDEKS